MSLKIMNIGFASDLKPTAKLIYIAIADFANDDGECFPSKSKLAEKASVSMSTMKYYLRAFENLGIIKTEQLYRSNGSKSSLFYKIDIQSKNLEKLKVENAYQECRKSKIKKKSHNVTVPKDGEKKENKNLLKVTIQKSNCDGLESSYINHQSLDEEEVAKYFADFYSYLNSIGVVATKSKQMHMNRIKANLLKGHKSTMENFNDFLLYQTAYDTAQESNTA
ncbi:helix-turn-helix domain-containing protein [Halarcobacter anaerophilus]|uniref:helix-turn-helix domain-containing protein n=1 Tax=Halarcobacter anaerophilus TaxID=877500 RepID=UPI0005C90E7C|nr:helix-turn-helix domain-containing protein [Halarcobacter anaerophilus]